MTQEIIKQVLILFLPYVTPTLFIIGAITVADYLRTLISDALGVGSKRRAY